MKVMNWRMAIAIGVPRVYRDEMNRTTTVENVNDQRSEKVGWVGLLETILRRFKHVAFVGALVPIVFLYVICLGIALTPGFLIYEAVSPSFVDQGILIYALVLGFITATGFLLFMFTLLFAVPLVNLPFLFLVKPYRGPWFSLESLPWYYHNALTYLVRYTVLNLMTPSPLTVLFYKMMGMKIGKNVMLNTGNISDPCLIEIGDYATIGGSVYMMAHYGQKGFLVVEKLKIGKAANIGLHSYLMGAVEVGEGAMVLPNTAVLPKTKIAAGARYDASLIDKSSSSMRE